MYNRIQKLLVAEYTDFNEVVLVESSFARVTSKGIGIAEVQLGLTESNLIIAGDFFLPSETSLREMWRYSLYDPEIETLELISVIPLTYAKLTLCGRRNRNLIKVTLATGRNLYFEFGEHFKRSFYYNIWADRIFAVNRDKFVSYSSTTTLTSSASSICTETALKVVEDSNMDAIKQGTCVLHRTESFDVNEESNPSIAKTKSSLKKKKSKPWEFRIPEDAVNPEIIQLKRRINQLNINIRKQVEKVLDGISEESVPLLEHNCPEVKENQSTHSNSSRKSVMKLFKRTYPIFDNSEENIWTQT